MARVNIFDDNRELIGWFDEHKADRYVEATEWDGNNHISVPTGDQFTHQDLYRTRGGRWVLCHWSQWQGTETWYEYLSDGEAREWLIANEHDDAVEEHFGAVEEERGPGRPEVGGTAITTILPDDMLDRLTAEADRQKIPRAELIRRLLAQAMGE